MNVIKGELEEPGFCRYAAEIMLPHVYQLEQELSGVVSSDDIEYIHRSRVATRRLRACLSIFSSCFSTRTANKWKSDIRLITRALGEARDLDVQIDFLKSYFSEHIHDNCTSKVLFHPEMDTTGQNELVILLSKETETHKISEKIIENQFFLSFSSPESRIGKEKHDEGSQTLSPADINRPGLECLLLRQMQRRQEIHPEVIKSIKNLEKRKTTESMKTYLHEMKIRAELEGSGIESPYSYQQAFLHIMTARSDFFSYESWLSDPLMVHRHHEMRIAAKKLRYTLESFSGLYECRLKDEIKTFKSLQDVLGEMHDCDVWIANLPVICRNEEKKSCYYFGNQTFFSLLKPGFGDLISNRKVKRVELFEKLNDIWFSLKKEGFWSRLEEKIATPVHYSFSGINQSCNDKPVSIALLSDVHANLPALEAVLADAKERGVTAVCNAGDSIGYGAFPDEVVTLLRTSHILSVIGNYDRSVLTKKWKIKRPHSRVKQIAMRFAFHHLSKKNRAYLKNLPQEIRIKVQGKSLLITHGSPESITEYLSQETPDSRFSEIATKTGADIIITGHSHLPSIKQIDDVWFVNCGSVGRTEDGDPRACYALLTIDPFSIVHIRVPYEITRAIEAIQMRHLPDSFERMISEGKGLDIVSPGDKSYET